MSNPEGTGGQKGKSAAGTTEVKKPIVGLRDLKEDLLGKILQQSGEGIQNYILSSRAGLGYLQKLLGSLYISADEEKNEEIAQLNFGILRSLTPGQKITFSQLRKIAARYGEVKKIEPSQQQAEQDSSSEASAQKVEQKSQPPLLNNLKIALNPQEFGQLTEEEIKKIKEYADFLGGKGVTFGITFTGNLTKEALDKLLKIIPTQNIRSLVFQNCQIGAAGAGDLAGVLGECTALAHLDLRGNNIGAEGAARLAGVLGKCTALAHLDLSGNEIGVAGAGDLAGVLGKCTALAHLDLSNNNIVSEGAGHLARVLGECKKLAHLNLSKNYIYSEGASRLAEGLGQCKALTHLNLSGNEIGDEGVGGLASVLGECRALTHLNLSNNKINNAGARYLVGALIECKALAHLDLSNNQIGDAGAGRLAKVLDECKALAHLDLSGNKINYYLSFNGWENDGSNRLTRIPVAATSQTPGGCFKPMLAKIIEKGKERIRQGCAIQ